MQDPNTKHQRRTRSGLPRRVRGGGASPRAFIQHEAVGETGERSRHSKLKTLLIVVPIVIVIALAIAGAVYAITSFSSQQDVEAGIPVSVTIPEGATTNEIANILKRANVIHDTKAFVKDVLSMGAQQSLKPGTYELETLMDSRMLVNLLVSGPVAVVSGQKLTIPEGLTVEQTAEIVESSCGVPQSEFLARAYAAGDYVLEYPFLDGVYNNSLEGFLYPKTYNIPRGSNADYIVRVLLDQFAIEISNLNISYAQDHGMTLFHVVTAASIIEEETAILDERPIISSVIYNRLSNDMKLQIDATVIYALGSDFVGSEVSYYDLEVDSPYNTYVVDELPAGPICSPSISSLEAAAHPSTTDYFYYVLTSKDGRHTFCETSEEFEVAKLEYNRIFGIE